MPTPTYTALANVVMSSSGTLTISNIPQNYIDLVLTISGTGTMTNQINLRINGDSGSNYSMVSMIGNGSTALANVFNSDNRVYVIPNYNLVDDYFIVHNFIEYSKTNKNKTILTRANSTTQSAAMAYRWNSNSAITSINIISTLGVGSTISLYGIAG